MTTSVTSKRTDVNGVDQGALLAVALEVVHPVVLGDHGVGVLGHELEVGGQHSLEDHELLLLDRLDHVLHVRRVEEEGARLARGVLHQHQGQFVQKGLLEGVVPDGLDVRLVRDAELRAQGFEHVRRVVVEPALPELLLQDRLELDGVFYFEIHRRGEALFVRGNELDALVDARDQGSHDVPLLVRDEDFLGGPGLVLHGVGVAVHRVRVLDRLRRLLQILVLVHPERAFQGLLVHDVQVLTVFGLDLAVHQRHDRLLSFKIQSVRHVVPVDFLDPVLPALVRLDLGQDLRDPLIQRNRQIQHLLQKARLVVLGGRQAFLDVLHRKHRLFPYCPGHRGPAESVPWVINLL